MKDIEQEYREQLLIALNLIDKEEKKVKVLLVETEKKKEEILKMRLRIAELDGESNILKQRFGWKDITDKEMKWVIENYPKGFRSFIPTLETIRREIKFQEEGEYYDVEVNSLWDYDRSLCHSKKTVGLRVKEVTDKIL